MTSRISTNVDFNPTVMTELLHCMLCFVRPTGTNKFYIGSCGHVICYDCLKEDLLASWTTCKKCGREGSRFLEINSSLPPEVRDLFLPLEQTFDTFIKDFNRNLDFQASHRIRLLKHLRGKTDQFNKLQSFCKSEVNKKEAYRQEILKLQEFKKKAVDQMRKLQNTDNYNKENIEEQTILASNIDADLENDTFALINPAMSYNESLNVSATDGSMSVCAVANVSTMDNRDDTMNLIARTADCEEPNAKFTYPSRASSFPPPVCKKRSVEKSEISESSKQAVPKTAKTALCNKKKKLDVGSKSQPLPLQKKL